MKTKQAISLAFTFAFFAMTAGDFVAAQSKNRNVANDRMAMKTMTKNTMTKKATSGKLMAKAGEVSRAYVNSFNVPSTGVALEGYCPVAYIMLNKPIKGSSEFASTYKDVTYYFVNADAKKAFEKEPERFVPAYGGWCALGMALNDKLPVDPTNFKVIDGRLNLFLRNKNIDALELWNKGDEQESVQKANAYWKKVSKS